jgi:hypothetical protein
MGTTNIILQYGCNNFDLIRLKQCSANDFEEHFSSCLAMILFIDCEVKSIFVIEFLWSDSSTCKQIRQLEIDILKVIHAKIVILMENVTVSLARKKFLARFLWLMINSK